MNCALQMKLRLHLQDAELKFIFSQGGIRRLCPRIQQHQIQRSLYELVLVVGIGSDATVKMITREMGMVQFI